MGKLLRGIAILLLPIALYFCVFIAFEPNNYFGLRAAPLRGDDIIAKMRGFETAPKSGVIVGDSRVAKVETALLEEAYGVEFANLAYGGASLTETLDMIEWVCERNPETKEILLGLSFYTLNAGYAHDRMITLAVKNPFVYMTNLTYNINMLETLALVAQNTLAKATGGTPIPMGAAAESRDPETYEYTQATDPVTGESFTIRADLLAYATQNIGPKTAGWKLDEAVLQRTIEVLTRCEARGVGVTVVLPPMDDSVWRLVIGPGGIEAPMGRAVEEIRASGATVLDYEFENRPAYGDALFFDGFHLDDERGRQVWTQQLLHDLQLIKKQE